MRRILGYVNHITAEADEAILALGCTQEERRARFMEFYRGLITEAPNFASYVRALSAVCTPDERLRLMVNLWAALEHEKLDERSEIMTAIMGMQSCREEMLVAFVRGKPKTIKACLEYLELLF